MYKKYQINCMVISLIHKNNHGNAQILVGSLNERFHNILYKVVYAMSLCT